MRSAIDLTALAVLALAMAAVLLLIWWMITTLRREARDDRRSP